MIRNGFTLVELLVVVAVIGILVAIALVNLLAAQVRSKVGRARAELQTLDTALNAFFLDREEYPRGNQYQMSTLAPATQLYDKGLVQLSTPVCYISTGLLDDPFGTEYYDTSFETGPEVKRENRKEARWYKYAARYRGQTVMTRYYERDLRDNRTEWFILQSSGPDRTMFVLGQSRIDPDHPEVFLSKIYDPTNGTASRGSIYRAGGDPKGDDARLAFDAIQAANH